MSVRVLVITGYGLNADKELGWAFELAGAKADVMHLADIVENKSILKDYQIIGFPGGFSFGDHITSGRIFANIIKHHFLDELRRFIDDKKLIIGICNGFQIITKLGLLPDFNNDNKQVASVIENDSGKFENRWVWLKTSDSSSPWLAGVDELYVPVRHGEGKFITDSPETLQLLKDNKQVAFSYINPNSNEVTYPYNPNGAVDNIAGITNKNGNVLGLMPHPEACIFKEHYPAWTEDDFNMENSGLELFKNGVKYFS